MRRFIAVLAVTGGLALPVAASVPAGQTPSPGASAAPAAQGWPREITAATAAILMYEPQLERVTENTVEARAAVQVTQTGKEPVFGAVWISARVNIDRDERLVTFRDIRIPRVRFVDASEADKAALAALLEKQMPTWDLRMNLDDFIPLLGLAELDGRGEVGLKHDPPKIIVATEPTTLVVIDGQPRQQALTTPAAAAGDKLERVVNTPALIVYHPARKLYYLAGGGDLWYSAGAAAGPYAAATGVPASVSGLAPKADPADAAEGKPPAIVVSTEPAEIIVVAGQPQYAPIGDVDLLAVSNTDADIIVTMGTRAHYVLLSGRWYVSRNALQGPWAFVPPGELPADFARIPGSSDHAHVRAHVPGTVEAQEALLDNTIPETQAIKRDDTSVTVTYDGTPVFKPVEGAPAVQFAANTPQSVFKVGSRYYACEQGVWYDSASPTGPWAVSTSVPKEIYGIPASNPHHNVTYVRVYDVTPQVVYVGYTPGYLGSYPYGGCIVYGTGWYYPGWYGRVYYPYPATWGFHATYNPYYGWGFGIGWSSGPLTVTIGFGGPTWGYPGWWGPWGYRPYYPPYRPPYYPGYRPPYYPGYRPPGYPGYRPPVVAPRPGTPVQLPAMGGGVRPPEPSLYRRGGNQARNLPAAPGTMDRARPAPATPPTRPNDIFTSPAGDVFRRNPTGDWDQRAGGGWKPDPSAGGGATRPAATPATRPGQGTGAGAGAGRGGVGTGRGTVPTPAARPAIPSTGGLSRDFAARQRGAARSGAAPRPAPGRAGGRGRGSFGA